MTGIDELLEAILVQAEVLELTANPDVMAKAVVVESTLEKGRGPVATVIVQNGTLRIGDNIVCGGAYGRVRALINDRKVQLQEIGPSQTAVVVVSSRTCTWTTRPCSSSATLRSSTSS